MKISRRQFLGRVVKGTVGTTIVGGIGYAMLRDKLDEKALEKSLRDKAPRITRHPNSAKSVIENTPEISTKEMGWVKQKGTRGQLKEAALRRTSTSVDPAKTIPNVRSETHTHLMPSFENVVSALKRSNLSTNPLFVQKILAYPSPRDLSRFLQAQEKNNAPRVMHIAAIDSASGKFVGYVSFRVTKKMINTIKHPRLL